MARRRKAENKVNMRAEDFELLPYGPPAGTQERKLPDALQKLKEIREKHGLNNTHPTLRGYLK